MRAEVAPAPPTPQYGAGPGYEIGAKLPAPSAFFTAAALGATVPQTSDDCATAAPANAAQPTTMATRMTVNGIDRARLNARAKIAGDEEGPGPRQGLPPVMAGSRVAPSSSLRSQGEKPASMPVCWLSCCCACWPRC